MSSKGNDKFNFSYIDSQLQVTCGVCHHIFDESPGIDNFTFNCPKCNRYFRLMYGIKILSQEEIEKYIKITGVKASRISFKDL